jgi:hypothetical protein
LRLEQAPPGVGYSPRWQLAVRDEGDVFSSAARPQLPLVLWSIPPSPDLLRWLLNTAQPQEVYLCGQYTADDTMSAVLRAVAGMCKYALNHPHQVTPPVNSTSTPALPPAMPTAPAVEAPSQPTSLLDVNRMAARLGITEAVMRQALLWMEARGEIYLIEWQAGDTVRIADGDGQPRRDQLKQIEGEIEELLAEVRAFRRFFQRSRLADLNLRVGAAA